MAPSEFEHCYPSQYRRFFRSWIQDPMAIGAVAPSGRLLAKLMVSDLYFGARVIELGSGTGTVTQAILDRGVREHDLCLIEQHDEFTRILQHRFPSATTVKADALSLAHHLRSLSGSVDFVISGLPLLLFSGPKKRRLLSQAFELLGAGGAFHQFTYAGRCPVSKRSLRQLGLRASRLGIAAFNFPPAFVYRIERAD